MCNKCGSGGWSNIVPFMSVYDTLADKGQRCGSVITKGLKKTPAINRGIYYHVVHVFRMTIWTKSE